ncbi:MAG: HAD-IIIC family phosphatase [Lachnospiraceae bacterium]|nr:HAD-IIIC family phosphatase [Lachnospiraceae bacterium]
MKCLEYPFDPNYILEKKKKIRRELLEVGGPFIDKKIAILGGSTTNDIRLILELFLLDQGIRPAFYESEYNRYYEDAMFPNPELEEFGPDVVYIHTTNRNITAYPAPGDDEKAVENLLLTEYEKFRKMWDRIFEVYRCPVIQNDFEMPYFRLLGNRDAVDPRGRVHFLSELNRKFFSYARDHENFHICDINYLSADFGLKDWADPFYYHMYKYALSLPAIPYLAQNVANIIKSLFGKNKKGLVLDLDNTLWGGVIGDDGVENIELGPEESTGQAYSEFQEYLKQLKTLGILLNIDSKNDPENALAGLRHPDSTLKEEDFIEIMANWEPKDQNFRKIARELNLLPESLVFIDDNPAERHIVREQIKGVRAPEIGGIQDYIRVIDRSGFFEVTALSGDDLKRSEMYAENAKRRAFEESFSDYREYLVSLKMKAVIGAFEPLYMARIAQLTNKSNQFNLTTKRYTQAEIEEAAKDPERVTLYGKLEDRFGDNGVVSVVIGHFSGGILKIELWLMSCRVLKRDMEFAMMDALASECLKRGIREIRGYYYPTPKNGMVRDFYAIMGFEKISGDDKGNTEWTFDLTKPYEKKNTVIETADR